MGSINFVSIDSVFVFDSSNDLWDLKNLYRWIQYLVVDSVLSVRGASVTGKDASVTGSVTGGVRAM